MSGFASMDIPDWQSFDVSENKNKKAEGQKPKPVKQSDKKTDNKDNSGVKKEVEKAKDTKKDKNAKDDKDTNKKTVKDNKKDDKKDSQKDKAKLSNNKSIFDEYEENIELKKKEINPEKMDNIKDDKPNRD